jgi:DNA-binding GntR family transcriptional regulator
MKDRLVNELRTKILHGELKPHQRVTEQDLVEEYGVSRSVVREAMVVLELQGLLSSTPYVGTTVASISRREVEGLLLPLRIQIEQFALREGIPSFDSDTFDAFADVLRRMEKAVYDKDIQAFNEVDWEFHELIVVSSQSDTARLTWDAIHPRIVMHFAIQTGRSGALPQFLADHRQLVEVFRTGDVEACVDAIACHIHDTNAPFLGLLEDSDSTPPPRPSLQRPHIAVNRPHLYQATPKPSIKGDTPCPCPPRPNRPRRSTSVPNHAPTSSWSSVPCSSSASLSPPC